MNMHEKLKLYGSPASNATQRVLFTLAEKNQAIDFEVVDLLNRQQKTPEFLEKNPIGKVPVLVDGDYTLYESMAIVRYLDKIVEPDSLTPKEAKERGYMEQWISVHACYLSPSVGKIMYNKIFMTMRGQPVDTAMVESAREEIAKILDVMDKSLEDQPYLSGQHFSVAEICFIPDLQILFMSGDQDLILERENVARWWAMASQRPTWEKVLAEAKQYMDAIKKAF